MSEWLEMELPLWEAIARVCIAMLFGALVGWDRESGGHAAGLRTHMMVAIGSAAFTLVAVELLAELIKMQQAQGGGSPNGYPDPVRIIAAVVGGIGFLGAGAIIHSGERVKGLTTAASLWVVASIGMAAGMGYYLIAIMVTVATIITLSLLRFVEERAMESEEKPQKSSSSGKER